MRIIEFVDEGLDQVPGVPLKNGVVIEKAAFSEFERTVSQKVLRWIGDKSWVVPVGMETLAVVSTQHPPATRMYYDRGIYADVDGTKRVLSNDHFDIWLCDSEQLVLKLVSVFHHEIARTTMGNEVKLAFAERILQSLHRESAEIHHGLVDLHREQHRLEGRKELLAQLQPLRADFQF